MIYDLKAYRLAKELTQTEMGEILGLTKSAVCMIETGKRPLPDAAYHQLLNLQQKTDERTGEHLQAANETFFHDIMSGHRKTSGDYIAIHCGDLRSEMHHLNKQIIGWTIKFNDAGRQLVRIQHMLLSMRNANGLSAFTYDSMMMEKMGAEHQLTEALKQKPELAMLRIEGIKKELEAAKKLLGKRNRFPIVDEVTNYFGFSTASKTLPSSTTENDALPPPAENV